MIMGFIYFPLDISTKVNVIAQQEFELANFEITVQHFNQYATQTTNLRFMCK